MNRHLRSGSRTNRDRRDQAFARSVIAEATRRHNVEQLCDCIASGNESKPKQHGADPHAKNCAVYQRPLVDPQAFDLAHGLVRNEMEVCPDCFGTGEVVGHVSDETVTEAICLECNGTGWVK